MGYQKHGGIEPPIAHTELEGYLVAAQKGDPAAFEMIWKNLNPRISRYAAVQCYGSSLDYEEVVSEAWISVAKDISKFKGDFAAFRSWVYALTRNRLIDGVRKRDRQVKNGGDVTELNIEDSAPAMEELIESDEAVKSIVQRINQLPKAQAEIVMLRIVADLTVPETAKVVSKSENTVRVLCHRGLTTLRENWPSQDGAHE